MTQQMTPPYFLGSTARWTAAVRSKESGREDCLFNDPWAARLAGEEGAAWLTGRPEQSLAPIVLRTRYFDDFLQRITSQEAIRQVALPGAGLDTRAFRLSWPAGVRLFELDQPEVLVYKEDTLRDAGAMPKCERQVVGADLTEPWREKLVQVGFDPQQPSAWLLEGFLFYLPVDSIMGLLDEVTALAASGSWLGFDIINHAILTHPLTRPWVEMQAQLGAPWIGWLDNPVAFLAQRGWRASLSQAGQPDANYGRWPLPVIPTTAPDMPHNWFVTAEKG